MELVFQESAEHSPDIYSFSFKPATRMTWLAGQSIKLELAGPYGPTEHRFTIASAPHTGIIAITTRLSGSDFKNSLAALQPGDTAKGYAIEGDFVWRDSPAPHTFVAAGIGITPFYAILAQRAFEHKPMNATLLYGTREPILYKAELEGWLTPTYILGRRLRVDDIPNTNGLLYLSGPSAMVDELAAALVQRGVPEQHILRDWFTGRLPLEG